MTGPAFQVTFDCREPHALSAFWCAALGYEPEDHTDRVKQGVDAGFLQPGQTVDLGDGRLGFAMVAGARDPSGARPRLLFQVVPEGKTAKNRVHLDVNVGRDELDGETKRLEGLGATNARRVDAPWGESWVTMQDPEGNEFCIQ